ncbi:oligosaccharide flippase family protein [Peribacillus simplex]|uniref:oligosaccharide flippase family protein n=1 Tax=Peribacillus simplex TaxID=1478 RepID=UPI0011A41318|nr:oligosaccharide flippase family protein [Peribacillus simplex]
MNKIIKNIVSLFLLKGVDYVYPLVLIPLLIKTLGIDNYGEIVFSVSIISFFVIVVNYGFDYSVTKKIAELKSENNKTTSNLAIRKIVTTTYYAKGLLTLFSILVILIIWLLFLNSKVHFNILVISLITLISNILNPVWFFQGIQKMGYITIISFGSKLATIVLAIKIINSPNDLIFGAFAYVLPNLISGLLGFLVLLKIQGLSVKFNFVDVKQTLKEGWSVFLSIISSSSLTVFIPIFLGIFYNNAIVGAYVSIEKIARAFLGCFQPITQAVYPYISSIKRNSGKRAIKLIKILGVLLFCAAIILSLFIVVYGKDIIGILYGSEMENYYFILYYFALLIPFSVLNNVIGIQYMVNFGLEKQYSRAFIFTSLSAVVLYYIGNAFWELKGVLLTLVFSEVLLTLTMILFIFKNRS